MLAGKMSIYGLALIMRCQIPFADLNLFAGLLCSRALTYLQAKKPNMCSSFNNEDVLPGYRDGQQSKIS